MIEIKTTGQFKLALRPILTAAFHRGRDLVITLHPAYVEIRQKGTRQSYSVDYGAIWDLGARQTAERARAEKLAARKAKRKAAA